MKVNDLVIFVGMSEYSAKHWASLGKNLGNFGVVKETEQDEIQGTVSRVLFDRYIGQSEEIDNFWWVEDVEIQSYKLEVGKPALMRLNIDDPSEAPELVMVNGRTEYGEDESFVTDYDIETQRGQKFYHIPGMFLRPTFLEGVKIGKETEPERTSEVAG